MSNYVVKTALGGKMSVLFPEQKLLWDVCNMQSHLDVHGPTIQIGH